MYKVVETRKKVLVEWTVLQATLDLATEHVMWCLTKVVLQALLVISVVLDARSRIQDATLPTSRICQCDGKCVPSASGRSPLIDHDMPFSWLTYGLVERLLRWKLRDRACTPVS
mmetsp:Transcript_22277/g.42509  ORF Transcript_22277/g.42509 Transcript_22277/m.42509 type:complete len:114 (+) Transcript_22277:977-1318(+)